MPGNTLAVINKFLEHPAALEDSGWPFVNWYLNFHKSFQGCMVLNIPTSGL